MLGQKVAALVVSQKGLSLEELRIFAGSRLPRYQLPEMIHLQTEELPKNAMGKVNKKQLLVHFPRK